MTARSRRRARDAVRRAEVVDLAEWRRRRAADDLDRWAPDEAGRPYDWKVDGDGLA